MQPQTLDSRVERLETRVTALEQLPARMDALGLQLSQFRDEVRVEFSATREGLRDEIRSGDEAVIRTLREEIRAGDEAVIRTLREEIRAGDEVVIRTLREEIRAGDERILTQARVLHEEVLSRLTVIQDAGPRRSKRR
jgi:hypothetical protein